MISITEQRNNTIDYYNLYRGGRVEKLQNDVVDLKLGTTDFNYNLILRQQATYQPYVVAWKFDSNSATWGQGHYFTDFDSALLFLVEKQKEIISSYHSVA